MGSDFHAFRGKSGSLSRLGGEALPSTLLAWNRDRLTTRDHGTTHGFVAEGETVLTTAAGEFRLAGGMYFSVPGAATLEGGSGVAVTRHGYKGFFQVGGPIEERGRLRYIDGCTDSLLIPPVTLGDPCLNLLHIPPGTVQTQHTHPSFRAGMIVSGHGRCATPDATHELTPGLVFAIDADGLHSFHTDDEALRVIAYHPDSDFGPTHEVHPMVNRTLIPTPS